MSEAQRQHARQRTPGATEGPPNRPEPAEGPAATYEKDRGPWAPNNGQEPAGVADLSPDAPAPEAAAEPAPQPVSAAAEGDLAAQLEAERSKANEYLEQWRRTAADFTNFKRRTEQERAEMAKLFVEGLVKSLLPVLDNFERALASVPEEMKGSGWVEGVNLTEKQLRAALEKEGLSPIQALGQPFDPNLHEAVAHEVSTEHQEDSVIEEFQRGYKLHDRVIRPSMVKVSRRS
ncbi:MAG TPA: nucleotide exchange factor GrpE [Chloroflexota bacterium]|nr:nucleotide exchange factor GrpE [Chloroflexota bacterium]